MTKKLLKITLTFLLISSCAYAAQICLPKANIKDNVSLTKHQSFITSNILWDDTVHPIFIGK